MDGRVLRNNENRTGLVGRNCIWSAAKRKLDDLRARVPKRYKMRFYPDITHSLAAQYPVPDWDFAFISTLNRETINPRPVDETKIFKRIQPLAKYGFLTYSEGCNDDVNKFIWSGLGWDPDVTVTDILRDYSKYFIGTGVEESFAQGLLIWNATGGAHWWITRTYSSPFSISRDGTNQPHLRCY